jgi:hypothetical protein
MRAKNRGARLSGNQRKDATLTKYCHIVGKKLRQK